MKYSIVGTYFLFIAHLDIVMWRIFGAIWWFKNQLFIVTKTNDLFFNY